MTIHDLMDFDRIEAAGTAGDDRLIGQSLFGLGGDDTLVFLMSAQAGTRIMDGGAGHDTLILDASKATASLEVLADGTAILQDDLTGRLELRGIETIRFTDGDMAVVLPDLPVVLPGTPGDDDHAGGSANDTLGGAAGNDLLRGGAGDDSLSGGAGNDTLDGGAGTDRMEGGAGDDLYLGAGPGDLLLEAAKGGTDTVLSSVTLTLSRNVENLTLTGPGRLDGTGTAGRNVLTGAEGANLLQGLGGADRLMGLGGADTLVGGTGRDVFVFLSATDSRPGARGRDLLADFQGGSDRIDLSALDADAGLAGDQAFAFSRTAKAHSVWVKDTGTALLLRADLTGDRVADFEIGLAAEARLSASDLWL